MHLCNLRYHFNFCINLLFLRFYVLIYNRITAIPRGKMSLKSIEYQNVPLFSCILWVLLYSQKWLELRQMIFFSLVKNAKKMWILMVFLHYKHDLRRSTRLV